MNQQTNYLECFKGILKQVQDEVKRLYSKQEELNRREQNILTIKDNTTQILKLLQGQQVELSQHRLVSSSNDENAMHEFPHNNDNVDGFQASNDSGKINEQTYQNNEHNTNENNITISEPKDNYSKSVFNQINQLQRDPSLFIPKIE